MPFRKLVYTDNYYVDIGQHVFPTVKYRLIRKKLIEENGFKEADFVAPEKATDEDLLLIHTKEYIEKMKSGALTPAEIFTLELPYSKKLVNASYFCVGGTILAARIALDEGTGLHIGGGFHHAFPDHGEGFCVFNDIAVSVRRMQKEKRAKRVFIIDCDLHHGNGTAFIFSKDEDVFTFSIHQENNYPFFKPKSSLDIGLRDRARDDEYIDNLRRHIPQIISEFKPDLIVYVAGADPYKEDKIGNLALTIEGLERRDKFIFETARSYDVPIACVLAGGYARDYSDTVRIHCNTILAGLEET